MTFISSNMVRSLQTTYSSPKIFPTIIQVGKLRVEEKFEFENRKYLIIERNTNSRIIKSVCYEDAILTNKYKKNGKRSDPIQILRPNNRCGQIANFNFLTEVIWLQEIHGNNKPINKDCCYWCRSKLINDQFSKEFGSYCPNPDCPGDY